MTNAEYLIDTYKKQITNLEAKYESLERSILDLSHPNCKMLIEDNTKLEIEVGGLKAINKLCEAKLKEKDEWIALLRKAIEPFAKRSNRHIGIIGNKCA